MAPFSVIVFGLVVWTIAVSGAKQLRFQTTFSNDVFKQRDKIETNPIETLKSCCLTRDLFKLKCNFFF